jgi:stage V sporulation protein S
MNRLFGKLDLREIRIDRRLARFSSEAASAGSEVDVASPGVPSTLTWQVDEPSVPDGRTSGDPRPDGASSLHTEATGGEDVLKVSARSRPSAVAGAIAGVVREAGRAEVQAIGAGATNQAVKAVAIARDYLQETGIDVICLPAFIDVTIDDEDRTAIRLVVEPR